MAKGLVFVTHFERLRVPHGKLPRSYVFVCWGGFFRNNSTTFIYYHYLHHLILGDNQVGTQMRHNEYVRREPNSCVKCGRHVDRSDANKTFITLTRKWFFLNGEYVKNRRILLCADCGLEMIHAAGL